MPGPVLDVLIDRLNELVVIFFDDDDADDKTFLDQVKNLVLMKTKKLSFSTFRYKFNLVFYNCSSFVCSTKLKKNISQE